MKRTNDLISRPVGVESLEVRRLLSTGGVGVESIRWGNEQVLAHDGSWIISFKNLRGRPGTQKADGGAAISKFTDRLKLKEHLGERGLFRLDAPRKWNAKHVMGAIAKLKSVAFVEPDFIVTTALSANDPYYSDGSLWGLHNSGQSGGTADADIDAPEAWDIARGGGSIVGVIDTGVDYNHPDLASNIWVNPGEVAGDGKDNDGNGYVDDVHGWDFANDDNNPMDDNGHGTHVAGTIAGAGNNGVGVTGVNWNAQILPLKFMAANGSGSLSDAIAAINYATSLRNRGVNVRVTNNSWGGGGYSSSLYDAIRRSGDAGMLFIAAAGNSGTSNDLVASYPASYNLGNVISVAATDRRDARASFSNYGASSVDLAAPGVDILSTFPGGGYRSLSGTSMATPHVAGVAALAWSHSPNSSYGEIRDAILGGVDKIAALSGRVATGGRLNAANTLARLGFRVTGSNPAAGQSLATRPLDFTINFSRSYDAGSVQAADLRVNGIAASSVVLNDADTVTFHYNASPVSASGTQTMSLAAGSISAAGSGQSLAAWSASFQYQNQVGPAAPSNLAASPLSSSRIRLTWRDNSSVESGFKVEMSSDGGRTFRYLGSVGANATSATVSGLSSRTTYWFRIRAYNAAGDSPYSNVVSATTSGGFLGLFSTKRVLA